MVQNRSLSRPVPTQISPLKLATIVANPARNPNLHLANRQINQVQHIITISMVVTLSRRPTTGGPLRQRLTARARNNNRHK
jgi:hypothetical protein